MNWDFPIPVVQKQGIKTGNKFGDVARENRKSVWL